MPQGLRAIRGDCVFGWENCEHGSGWSMALICRMEHSIVVDVLPFCLCWLIALCERPSRLHNKTLSMRRGKRRQSTASRSTHDFRLNIQRFHLTSSPSH